ncbi:MAG: ABC transporter ATP-binding protein [Chloroflexota bacterium]
MFEANDIRSGYGEVVVLQGLTFQVEHEIFAVLGANGAGKSTLLKTIAKLLPLMTGSLKFKGADVSLTPAYQLTARGLAYVPQEHNVFPDLTVAENLSLGGLIGSRPKEERLEEVYELFPVIPDRLSQKAGTLSGGETQMVAIGRALMQDPKLLLLDEPTAGLAPLYVDNLFEKIKEIHVNQGVSVILAEQNASKTLAIAHRAMILSLGEIFTIEASENVEIDMLKEGYQF